MSCYALSKGLEHNMKKHHSSPRPKQAHKPLIYWPHRTYEVFYVRVSKGQTKHELKSNTVANLPKRYLPTKDQTSEENSITTKTPAHPYTGHLCYGWLDTWEHK